MTTTRRGLTGLHTVENRKLMESLAQARREAGLTQYELADRLKVDQTYVSKYESCRRRLDVIEFLRVAAAIGADPTQLISRAGVVG